MPVEIVRWREDQGPVLDRLMQLYVYDLSDLFPLPIDACGRFLDLDADRWVHAVEADVWRIELRGGLAGFALAMPTANGWFLEDFFVLKAHRRCGVGAMAASTVFAARPGPWSLTARAQNLAAVGFWRQTLPQATSVPELGEDGILRVRYRWISPSPA